MPEHKQVIAPSSPAAIRLAQLAGFNADLGLARTSLTIASHYAESQDPTELSLVRTLVVEATVAYGRCFTKSYVRPILSTIITVPSEYTAEHQNLLRLRHGTVAHSESNLTPTYSVAVLERDEVTGNVHAAQALAMTVHFSFSGEAIQLFIDLVRVVKEMLLVEIENAKAELIDELNASADLNALWDEGVLPQMEPISLDEWDVHTRRPEYPESGVIPIVVNPARTFLMPSTGDLYNRKGDEA
ncbi:hypothetical protein [Plantibacter sp. lyk4-40-MEA-4]|uniref:hypothetical protein n=1 Tax=Plantibacter sp. lyk4-40-MEA-4 TaxID=3040298 RepID=UPI00254AA0D2|nr:hypothetical protein [Plantibacter sp. lyk4-40-MEA-4]